MAPGLVARLMGLESLPADRENSSSPRSKLRRGRKVIPTTYQEIEEDDKFYTLRFGSNDGDESCRKKRRRRRRSRLDQNKENEGTGNSVRPLVNQKVEIVIPTRKKSDVVKEGDWSENSSPNSVLEFAEFRDDKTNACSGSRLGNSKMRRTLSDELESCRNPDKKKKTKEEEMNMKKRREQKYCDRKTGKLAAMEMAKWRWVEDEVLDNINLKEVGADVASHILDNLLDEFLHG